MLKWYILQFGVWQHVSEDCVISQEPYLEVREELKYTLYFKGAIFQQKDKNMHFGIDLLEWCSSQQKYQKCFLTYSTIYQQKMVK